MIAEDGGDGSLEDFAGVKLDPNSDVMDKLYHDAKAGSDLNLSTEEINKFKQLDKKASHEQIEQCLRQVLLDRFRAYKRNGLVRCTIHYIIRFNDANVLPRCIPYDSVKLNKPLYYLTKNATIHCSKCVLLYLFQAGISSYARGKKDFSVGQELKHQLEVAPILKKKAPVFWKYVLDYPDSKPDVSIESFFWVNSLIDDKPTIALVHRLGMPHDQGYVYMERHFYLSRSHNCLQGIGAALPAEDGGTAVFYATRTSTDQVGGFGGSAKRTIGNKIMVGSSFFIYFCILH